VKHVLISGVTSCESRGVEALVRSVATHAAIWPDQRTTVLTQTPDLDGAALADLEVRCVADPFVVSHSWQRLRPFETDQQLADRGAALLQAADLVIGTGGDLHTPDYHVSTPYLRVLAEAQRRGIPTALIGQSLGPFTDTAEADALVAIASRCELLSVRESVSAQYALDKLGLPPERIRVSADPAFLLPQATASRTAAVLADCGLGAADAYTCVAPSQGITRHSDLTEEQHLRALVHLVTRLADTRGVPVLLVPHCHDSRPHNDDRILAERIAVEARHPQVRSVRGELSATDYKGVLAGAGFVVAERLHAAIGAVSSGTPTIAIGHSHKFHGVLAETYGAGVAQERFHLDIHAFADDPQAAAVLTGADNEAVLRQALAARLPEAIAAARGDFTLLRRLLLG
jgi:polysaccharide pyruvyl transferase WcaK-like protein